MNTTGPLVRDAQCARQVFGLRRDGPLRVPLAAPREVSRKTSQRMTLYM